MNEHHSKNHNHRRHRHRSRDQSVIGEIASGVGTTLAVALQSAGQVVTHSLKTTDNIVQEIILGTRSSNSSHSQRHHQHYPQQQPAYPQQQYYTQQQYYLQQQHYFQQQHYQQQHYPHHLYPKQQYYQLQPPYKHEESPSNTFVYHGSHNTLSTQAPVADYGEAPPAYDDLSPGYNGGPPPAYSESVPARGSFITSR